MERLSFETDLRLRYLPKSSVTPPGDLDVSDQRFSRKPYLQMAFLAVLHGLAPQASERLTIRMNHEERF
jgi:hypothetical protein